jgi:hypothetical protein
MFSKTLVTVATAAIAVLSSASAFAASPEDFSLPTRYSSAVTRADVRAQAIAARQAPMHLEGDLYVADQNFVPSLTVAQVRAETLEAIALGVIGHGEKNVFATAQQQESIRMAGLRAVTMTLASR